MSQRNDELFEKIVELRAKRKGVARIEAEEVERSTPLFLMAAEASAKRLSTSPEAVLAADLRRMETSNYPTPECLTPDEIEDLIDAGMRTGSFGVQSVIRNVSSETFRLHMKTADPLRARLSHLEICDACRTLFAASRPTLERRAEFKRFLEAEVAPTSENQKCTVGPSSPRAFIIDLLSSIALPLLILLTFYVFSVKLVEHWAWILGGAVICLFVASCIMLVYFRSTNRGVLATLRWSGGALVGSVVVATIMGVYLLGQSRERQDFSLALGVDRLEDLALSSMVNREQRGRFLVAEQEAPLVSLTTEITSAEQAVYEAEADGLPGKLVTTLKPDTGGVYWDDGKQYQLRAKVLLGTVAEVSSDSFMLRSVDGKSTRIKVGSGVKPPTSNSRVAVAFDPNSFTATRIAEIE